DAQLRARSLQERSKLLTSIDWAHDEIVAAGLIWMALDVGVEEAAGFAHQIPVTRHHAKTAGTGNILVGKIEPQQVELAAVDDHHLAVVTDQIVSRTGYGYALGKEAHLELAQAIFAGAVGVGDERCHRNPTAYGRAQRTL